MQTAGKDFSTSENNNNKLNLVSVVTTTTTTTTKSHNSQPNFFFILADDLGYNSVGYEAHDLTSVAPYLTSLAKGVYLDQIEFLNLLMCFVVTYLM